MVFALGMLRQRSMLRAEPIRTPHRKATHTTDEPTPNETSIIHAHMCTQIKNFQGKRKQHSAHDLQLSLYPQFVLESNKYCVCCWICCITHSILFSSCSVFSSPKNGGRDSLYMPWVWIDFCLAHFSWFRLCHFQGAPDEGPLAHRGRRFSC